MATTNHFQSPALLAEQVGLVAHRSTNRQHRLEHLLAHGTVDVERVDGVLRDPCCLDETEPLWASLYNAGTVYSTIFEPAAGRLWVRATDRDDRRFVPVAVPGAMSRAVAENVAVGVLT